MQTWFLDSYAGKTVLVTGDTGFKGAWLTMWLHRLGARVVGYGLAPPTSPSLYESAEVWRLSTHYRGDVRSFHDLAKCFAEVQPDLAFHLAAQPLVRRARRESRETFETNFMGVVNFLEAARDTSSVQAAVCISTDKVYRNSDWSWAYRESDPLGGHEAYGASKACGELAIEAYRDPMFQRVTEPRRLLPIASARAGNVIGGGDWAEDRIVPDVVRACMADRTVLLRAPGSIRPWQHVLEPLSGYLQLGALLTRSPERAVGAWNFGPEASEHHTVLELAEGVLKRWPGTASQVEVPADADAAGESRVLRVDSSLAQRSLGWRSVWGFDETLDAVCDWYRTSIGKPAKQVLEISLEQIDAYVERAEIVGSAWAVAPSESCDRVRARSGGGHDV